jgi:hypothetical protein
VNWKPTGNVDSLDNAAIQDFWNAGPQVRPQWSNQIVQLPLVYWTSVGGAYALTGAGSSLGAKCIVDLSLP